MGGQCKYKRNVYLKNENEKKKKISGGGGIGKPACKLHTASPSGLHGKGNLKTRNWVISSVKNFYQICYPRDLTKMLLRAHASEETALMILSYYLSIFIGLQIWESFM